MAVNTPMDKIIDYKDLAIKKIIAFQPVMGLLFDDPNIDMESDEVSCAREHSIKDYGVNLDTIQTDKMIIFVQASMLDNNNTNFKDMAITISIVCNCNYIKLDYTKFKGIKGNRLDNIARQIALALDDEAQEFGIGSLTLVQCHPVAVPTGFSALELVFEVPEFPSNMRWND